MVMELDVWACVWHFAFSKGLAGLFMCESGFIRSSITRGLCSLHDFDVIKPFFGAGINYEFDYWIRLLLLNTRLYVS